CGGAPIPKPLADQVVAYLDCRLVPCWGMTELAVVTTVQPYDSPKRVVTMDGRRFEEMDLTIRDSLGAPGESSAGGRPVRPRRFHVRRLRPGSALHRAVLYGRGWLKTGDRAKCDADGCIRITGRSKDIIITGGENVPVKEIEEVLLRH